MICSLEGSLTSRLRGGMIRTPELVVVKVCNREWLDNDMLHELNITQRIATCTANIRGRSILATAVRAHRITSPWNSEHLLLVFKPLREPLSDN